MRKARRMHIHDRAVAELIKLLKGEGYEAWETNILDVFAKKGDEKIAIEVKRLNESTLDIRQILLALGQILFYRYVCQKFGVDNSKTQFWIAFPYNKERFEEWYGVGYLERLQSELHDFLRLYRVELHPFDYQW